MNLLFEEQGDFKVGTVLADNDASLLEAVSRGEFAPPDARLVGLLSGAAAALGVLLVVVLLTEV